MLDTSAATGFFPVESRPVYDAEGRIIPGYQSITNIDTDGSLAIHPATYKLVPHEQVFDAITRAAKVAGLPSDFETKTIFADGGRKFRIELLYRDLVVEPQVGDYVSFRAMGFNSYDASWSLQSKGEGLRLFCTNGCSTPDAISGIRQKHTVNLDLEAIGVSLTRSLKVFNDMPDVWREWRRVPVDRERAVDFFRKTVAKVTTLPGEEKQKTNNKQLAILDAQFRDECSMLGPNKWALYNALTYWSSHPHNSRNPEVTRRNREDMVQRAISTRAWKEIA